VTKLSPQQPWLGPGDAQLQHRGAFRAGVTARFGYDASLWVRVRTRPSRQTAKIGFDLHVLWASFAGVCCGVARLHG